MRSRYDARMRWLNNLFAAALMAALPRCTPSTKVANAPSSSRKAGPPAEDITSKPPPTWIDCTIDGYRFRVPPNWQYSPPPKLGAAMASGWCVSPTGDATVTVDQRTTETLDDWYPLTDANVARCVLRGVPCRVIRYRLEDPLEPADTMEVIAVGFPADAGTLVSASCETRAGDESMQALCRVILGSLVRAGKGDLND